MEERFARRLIPLVMLMCEVLETKGTTNLLHNLPSHETIRVIYFQFVLLQSLAGSDERVCEVCLKVDPRKRTDLAGRPLQPLRKLKTNKKLSNEELRGIVKISTP